MVRVIERLGAAHIRVFGGQTPKGAHTRRGQIGSVAET